MKRRRRSERKRDGRKSAAARRDELETFLSLALVELAIAILLIGFARARARVAEVDLTRAPAVRLVSAPLLLLYPLDPAASPVARSIASWRRGMKLLKVRCFGKSGLIDSGARSFLPLH